MVCKEKYIIYQILQCRGLFKFLKTGSGDIVIVVSDNRKSCSKYIYIQIKGKSIAWQYQTCTEFGFVTTTTSKNQPFHNSRKDIDKYIEDCVENFGERITIDVLQRGIDRINRVYGSTNLKVTQVVSIHGEMDPWYKLGLYEQNNEETPVIFISGTSHCADIINGEDDLAQLIQARKQAQKFMIKRLTMS